MKKALVISLSALMLIILCALAGLYWALRGPLATDMANQILRHYSKPINVYSATFHLPDHILLEGVEIREDGRAPLDIAQVDIRLNRQSLWQLKPTIDSLLISGINLQDGIPDIAGLSQLPLNQIAITNLDYSDGGVILRDSSIQINQPKFANHGQKIPYGIVQFSAEQVYWQGEAFDQVLLDMDYKAKDSTIYGASLEWRGASISGQAEQYEQGWSLINATLDKLRLTRKDWREIAAVDWSGLQSKLQHINSLDILGSSIETPDLTLTNVNLSLENLSLPFDMWQQENGYASLSAESITYLDQLWLEPAFESYFDQDLLTIGELGFGFQQGSIRTAGEITPDSAYLSYLNINGIKWVHESEDALAPLTRFLNQAQNLLIDKLEIKHSQFIQLASDPRWQVSGLGVEGRDLHLIKDGTWALWNGETRISANNASWQNLLSSHPLLSMHSDKGNWLIDDLFVPLEDGLIEATANIDLTKISQPWRIETSVDGLPVELFTRNLSLPIEVEALAEFQLSLHGLAGDKLMLGHSLGGQLVGSLREAVLIREQGDAANKKNQETITLPFDSSDIKLNADRGRIEILPVSIKGDGVSGSFSGKVDLVDRDDNTLSLELSEACSTTTIDLLERTLTRNNLCR